MYITVTFLTDRIVGDGTADSPYGYAAQKPVVDIQDQGENTVMDDDTYAAMLRMIGVFETNFDMEKQVDQFGVILYEQMQSLNSSMGGTAEHGVFTFTERGLELTDFYTFLALKMDPGLLDDYENANEEIRKTIKGLYEYDEDAPNDENFKTEQVMKNPPSDKGNRRWDSGDIAELFGGTPVNDKDFNGFIKQGVEVMAEDGDVNVKQTIILAKGDERAEADEVRDWLTAKLKLGEDEDVDASADYLVITFSMKMADYVGESADGSENKSQSLFPAEIYATVVYKYDENADGDKFTVVGGISGEIAPVVVFNNMDATQYEIMVRLMGANPEDTGANDDSKVNIKTIAKQGAKVLNGMSSYDFGGGVKAETKIEFDITGDISDGFGTITITPKNGVDSMYRSIL